MWCVGYIYTLFGWRLTSALAVRVNAFMYIVYAREPWKIFHSHLRSFLMLHSAHTMRLVQLGDMYIRVVAGRGGRYLLFKQAVTAVFSINCALWGWPTPPPPLLAFSAVRWERRHQYYSEIADYTQERTYIDRPGAKEKRENSEEQK